MLNLTADEVQTLMINRGYAVGAGFEKDALYIKLSKEWTRMQEEQVKQEIPAGFNEYDVESMGIDEIDRLIAENEQLRAAVSGVKRLNRPMLASLRACAADTSPNWDATATVYPPSARDLVALIDALLAVVVDAHEANGVKIVLMYAVLKDERGQYYVKDGERIDI